jgi:hypothetical protein
VCLVIEAVAPDRRLCSAVIHDLDAVTAIVYDLSAGVADGRCRIYRGSLERKSAAGFLTSTIDEVRSVQKLHQVVRQSGAQVVTGHDPEA